MRDDQGASAEPTGLSQAEPVPVSPLPASVPFADEYDDEWDNGDCWNCGGEGFVSDCFEEYACLHPEDGCDLCTRRCDVCHD